MILCQVPLPRQATSFAPKTPTSSSELLRLENYQAFGQHVFEQDAIRMHINIILETRSDGESGSATSNVDGASRSTSYLSLDAHRVATPRQSTTVAGMTTAAATPLRRRDSDYLSARASVLHRLGPPHPRSSHTEKVPMISQRGAANVPRLTPLWRLQRPPVRGSRRVEKVESNDIYGTNSHVLQLTNPPLTSLYHIVVSTGSSRPSSSFTFIPICSSS
ncbi:hypothetical protein LZ30DRAFT_424330 [Colletotrichum cereale]|nr:hypothetical protein LZ30DRAFT_424330 [Colletotrichum cereale]